MAESKCAPWGKIGKDDGIEEDKNYCLLIFLKRPKGIDPFEINKTGFGMMSAWLSVGNIDRVKV